MILSGRDGLERLGGVVAKTAIPNPLKRRHLIEQDMGAADALTVVEAYLEVDRTEEALVFLVKAEARDRLRVLAEEAIVDGDAFLLKQLADALAEDPGASAWERTAEAAQAAGKERYAEMARRHARSST